MKGMILMFVLSLVLVGCSRGNSSGDIENTTDIVIEQPEETVPEPDPDPILTPDPEPDPDPILTPDPEPEPEPDESEDEPVPFVWGQSKWGEANWQ